MRVFPVSGLLTAFLCAGLTGVSIAQTADPQVRVRYRTEGPGLEAFTTLEGFIPLESKPAESLLFTETRLLLDADSTISGGLTLGQRFYHQGRDGDASADRLTGFYGAWDVRNTGNSTFHQLGVGYENVGDAWELRANVFLPIGSRRNLLSSAFSGQSQFQGNQLLLGRNQVFESAVAGLEVEAGSPILRWSEGDLRGYGGLYYLSAQGNGDVVGVRGRLVARPNPYTSASLTLQHDSLFDTRLVASIGVHFPARSGSQTVGIPVLDQMAEPIQRTNGVMVDHQVVQDQVVAVNPQTQQELFFVHVGNGNSNGTVESPFSQMEEAIALAQQQQDKTVIIYLNGENLTFNGFTLPNTVSQLLSSGPVQQVNTQFGLTQLPFSGNGRIPRINGRILLPTGGQNIVVSGFNINAGGTQRGIEGQRLNNVQILNNTINNALGEGIYLENVTGKVEILNNTVRNTVHNPDPILTELNGAILVNNSVSGLDLLIANNLVETDFAINATYEVDGIELSLCRTGAVSIYPGCTAPTTATVRILNNTVINRGTVNAAGADGIDINLDTNAQGNIEIRNNRIEKMPDKAISFGSAGSGRVVRGVIADNVIENAVDNGIHVRVRETSIFDDLLITNNRVNNANWGIDVRMDDDDGLLTPARGTAWVVVRDNLLTNSKEGGIRLRAEDQSTLFVTVEGNQIVGNTTNDDGGIFARSRDDSQLTVTIANNTVSGITGDAGIWARSQDTSRLSATIRDNTVSGTTGDAGIMGRSEDDSRLCIRLENNTSTNNVAAEDFFLRRQDASTLELFGIAAPIAALDPSPALQTALTNLGNVGEANKFRVRDNSVLVPTAGCTFPD
ncbi:right-handed parallel beta-helix repeat-containing protein [Spirulina major CS-329]|uniref:right-handed parallel beta-helix repeat-containing protein n=1 Tax=Spirulina TaxID=1154 RepID=UPI00232C8EEC|nr:MULTISPECIES: right-handed parallel beta-helix repeat-containing protein [Spirulina]MDB9493045.1 right-handed parallel beta-helix repeat-containing protein [Spirulina subsalsa CS-330]MDB9501914.1 right-handed parallel beta-helix repeat-containing protein [Spirulina major CS-329]